MRARPRTAGWLDALAEGETCVNLGKGLTKVVEILLMTHRWREKKKKKISEFSHCFPC